MTDFSITLTIPQDLYDRAQRLAQQKALPIEQVLVRQLQAILVELPPLPGDEQAELEALTHLSDEALWTIAREQMSPDPQQRMQVLMDRNNLGSIAASEHAELTLLVEQGQRLLLRKAKAMALLAARGHSIESDMLGHE